MDASENNNDQPIGMTNDDKLPDDLLYAKERSIFDVEKNRNANLIESLKFGKPMTVWMIDSAGLYGSRRKLGTIGHVDIDRIISQ